jgi:hypothetical protein
VNGTLEALRHTTGGLDYLIVAERARTLYIRVPKAACTTMLWGILELEGHDPSIMKRSRNALLSTPDTVVHDMDLYPVPALDHVGPALRQDALTNPAWLRLALVRNPYARLYSAWESKILLRPPGNRRFGGAPELVETAQGVDVGASFRSFVTTLSENSERWLADGHFRRQADLIPTSVISDIELAPTSSIPDLFRRLSDRAGVTVAPRRSNKGLGIDGTAFLDTETVERIAALYKPDFELTGADPAAFTPGDPVILDSVALALLHLAAARSARAVQLTLSSHQAARSRFKTMARRATGRLSRS